MVYELERSLSVPSSLYDAEREGVGGLDLQIADRRLEVAGLVVPWSWDVDGGALGATGRTNVHR